MSMERNSSEELLEVLSAEKSRIAREISDMEDRQNKVDRFHRRISGIVNGDYLVEVYDREIPDSNVTVYVHTNSVDDVIVKFYDNDIVVDINVEDAKRADYEYTVKVTLDIDAYELAMDNYLAMEPHTA